MIGTTLSHFRITAKLGEGGMGEVYRAEDTKLGREVAIKVLPEVVAGDPERLARFEREAKVLAALNHPHIASIYALESAAAKGPAESPAVPTHFLVMELAEGEDLSGRISRGPIPVEEAIPIALQIAEALEVAHERGIVHRDLKPANIKADGEGNVKVLDFGLAKAMDPTTDIGTGSGAGKSPSVIPLSMSPTLTAQMTEVGVILGTAAYMSPEQAKGKSADKRSDIWAFGVVLYEMLTGEQLFAADSVAETLGAIFRQDIDLDALPANTPGRVRRLLARCLERDPRMRLRDIGEARIALEAADREEPEIAEAASAVGPKSGISPLLFAVALLAIAAGATWLGMKLLAAPAAPPPEIVEFSIEAEGVEAAALSPDGRRVAWTDGDRLYVRDLDDRRPREVLAADGIGDMFWSPDSRDLAVDVDEKLWRLDVGTGEKALICDLPDLPKVPRAFILAGTWKPDDTILLAVWRGGIYEVPARGGAPEVFVPIDPDVDVDFHTIVTLPGSESLILDAHYQDPASTGREIRGAVELYRNGERSVLDLSALGSVSGGSASGGSASGGSESGSSDLTAVGYVGGRLLVRQYGVGDGQLWALPFDVDEGRVIPGERELLFSDIGSTLASPDGTLLYRVREKRPTVVSRVAETGRELAVLGESRENLRFPTLSPDGSRMASVVDLRELWVDDLERGTSTLLARDNEQIEDPQWTPDGTSLYYTSGNRSRLFRVRAAPGAVPELIDDEAFRSFLAPDGSGLLINRGGFQLQRSGGLYWFPLDGEGRLGEGEKIIDGFQLTGRLSPDGRLLAYRSAGDGPPDAFLTTFPDTDQTIQLSSGSASTPRWSLDGKTVYYLSRDGMVAVEVELDPSGRLRASPEERLFDFGELGLPTRPDGWDVTPDGFLFIKPLATHDKSEMVVRRHALSGETR